MMEPGIVGNTVVSDTASVVTISVNKERERVRERERGSGRGRHRSLLSECPGSLVSGVRN